MRKKMKRIFVTLSVFLLISCSNQSDNELNIYTSRQPQLLEPIIEDFYADTGIKVNLLSGNAQELMERIDIEGENTKADIFMTVDAGVLWQANERGIFSEIESDILSNNIPTYLKDPNNSWFGFSKRARTIVYSSDEYSEDDFSTYEDLADPKWKGKLLARSSSNIYNQSLLASIIANNGKQSAMKWAAAVRKNMARPPEGSDRDQMRAVAAGIGDVAIANTYYVGLLVNSSNPKDQEVAKKVGVFFPNQKGRGAHINISGGGIVKWSKNKANAVKLLEFLTGPEAQEQFPNATYEFPLEINSTNSELLQSWGKFKADPLSLSELGKLNSEAVKIFALSNWK